MKLNFYILLLCLSSIGITSWGRNATPTSHLTVLQLNIVSFSSKYFHCNHEVSNKHNSYNLSGRNKRQ